jgi:hypothetical protein
MKKAMQKTTSLPEVMTSQTNDVVQTFLDKFKSIDFAKKRWKVGDQCPNCNKGILDMTPLAKSIYEMRYIYYLFCRTCGFKYITKVGITGAGKIKKTDFSYKELDTMRKQGIKI